MSNPTLKNLLKEYEQNRLESEIQLDEKLRNFYIKNPDISNLNDKINKTSIEISKNILLNNDKEKINKLKTDLENYKAEKNNLLKKLNITDEFFKPNYSCKLCNDTGYLVDNNSVMCTCFKQK